MHPGWILLGLICSTGLAACGEPTQLYIAHNTVVGLDAAVDTNRQSGRLLFGYDRQFVALAPKSVPHKGDPQDSGAVCNAPEANCREAMAALSCNEVVVEGIFLTRFRDRLATGTAATNAAKAIVDFVKSKPTSEQDREIAGALFDCWRVVETEQDQQQIVE